MTTVIAVETPKGVILGSDSQVTSYGKEPMNGPKYFKNGGVVFALAGRARFIQELRYGRIPAVRGDVDRYVHTKLVPFIRDLAEKTELKEENQFIVVVKDRVYKIDPDLTVSRSASRVYVIGSGTPWATAYLSTVSKVDESAVKKALEVAAKHDPYTSGPFHVSMGL